MIHYFRNIIFLSSRSYAVETVDARIIYLFLSNALTLIAFCCPIVHCCSTRDAWLLGHVPRATCHMTRDTCPLTRPCVVPGAEDAVVTRVKGYIDAGTCGSVTFTAYSAAECGDNAASYYREFEYGGKRVQVTNNVSQQIFSTKIKYILLLLSDPWPRCWARPAAE